MSATVYLNKIQILADTLASIGQPLCPSEFQSFVINGLDDEYDSLFEAVNNRDEPMRPRDLYARLLSTEQRLEARRADDVYSDAFANAVARAHY
jgi:hypothetical protein